ncbi:MAG: hypothetical protein ACYDHY_06670 [Acidiferrobacterales bacterium]
MSLYERYFEKWEPIPHRSKKTKMERRRIRRRFEKEKAIVSACEYETDVGDVTKPPGKR